jgi:membrane associated rhomboid family serine protease
MMGRRNLTLGSDRNALTFLIAATLAVSFIVAMLKFIFIMQSRVAGQTVGMFTWASPLGVPDTWGEWIRRPWTLFIYSYVHISIIYLFSNLIWMFSFGMLMQNLGGNRHILPVYFYGQWIAALVFMSTYSFFPGTPMGHVLLGATAPVLALSVAATTIAPKLKVFPMIAGGIPLWGLMALFLAIDFLSLLATNPGLLPTHVAAALTGFLYMKQLQSGRNFGAWMHRLYEYVTGPVMETPETGTSEKNKLFYRDKSVKPYEKKRKITEDTVNEILDKINSQGYASLTKEERDVLKKAKDEL